MAGSIQRGGEAGGGAEDNTQIHLPWGNQSYFAKRLDGGTQSRGGQRDNSTKVAGATRNQQQNGDTGECRSLGTHGDPPLKIADCHSVNATPLLRWYLRRE